MAMHRHVFTPAAVALARRPIHCLLPAINREAAVIRARRAMTALGEFACCLVILGGGMVLIGFASLSH